MGYLRHDGTHQAASPVDDLSTFRCQNADCPDYGSRGHGNLVVHTRYGATKAYGL